MPARRAADEHRSIRLDRGRVVELRGDRAGLPAEEVLADERRPRRQRVAAELADASTRPARSPRVGGWSSYAVQRLERERDLAEVCVAGALAHAVDGSVDPVGARPDRGDRAGGRKAEVVVAVVVQRHVRADRVADAPDEVGDRLRRSDAERVDDDDLRRARSRSRAGIPAARKSRSAREPSTPKNATRTPASSRDRHRALDPLEHLRARHAERVELEVGDGRLDHRRAKAELDDRVARRPARPARSPTARREGRRRRSARSRARSSSETRGKPTSIRSTPSASSSRAISSFSSGPRTTPTVCSPSRSVVS